jgi:hypothetical protein
MATPSPTSFPTKTGQEVGEDQDGSYCTSSVAFPDGKFTRNVGWVGAGPGSDYCNVWKCDVGETGFTVPGASGVFKKQVRVCSVDEHKSKGKYCTHVKCTFSHTATSSGKKLVSVKHDHKEKYGGSHLCSYSKNPHTGQSGVTGHIDDCACLCYGDRRQDKDGFARKIKEVSSIFDISDSRVVDDDNHDPTVTAPTAFDRAGNNPNNFFSEHSNTKGEPKPNGLSRDDTTVSQYNEKDHTYAGQKVGHYHINK